MPKIERNLHIDIQRWIIEHPDYSLAYNFGKARDTSNLQAELGYGFLKNHKRQTKQTGWFGRSVTRREFPFFLNDKLNLLSVHGECNMDEAMRVAEELEKEFNLQITVRLETTKPRLEEFDSDCDY